MAESETAKKIKAVVNAGDRLASNIQRDTAKLLEALKQLKEMGKE